MFENIKSVGEGWNAYANKDENPWIGFAIDHDIELKRQSIKVEKNKKSPFKTITPVKRIGKHVKFLESPWSKWERQHTKSTILYKTINEYRQDFPRKRPNWAMSFRERKIKDVTNYMEEFVIPVEHWSSQSHYIEREIWTSAKAQGGKYVVERILDSDGRVTSVNKALIYKGGGSFNVWTNERISKMGWESGECYVCDGEWQKKKPLQFLRVKEPWSNLFIVSHNVIDTPLE